MTGHVPSVFIYIVFFCDYRGNDDVVDVWHDVLIGEMDT